VAVSGRRPPGGVGVASGRRFIREVADAKGTVCVAGRVLVAGEGEFRLADETGDVLVRGVAVAGDIVEVRGTLRAAAHGTGTGASPEAGTKAHEGARGRLIEAARVTVLTPYRGRAPFPAPGGEAWRLTPARRAGLVARGRALGAIREFLGARGFLEVETPLRVPGPGLEVHLVAEPCGDRWLITSPEYQMKRLLVGGCERIYQLCKCFRRGEVGSHHGPEFTMLEWYRALAGYEVIAVDTEELCAAVARAVCGRTVLTHGGVTCDLEPPWERLTVAEAMRRYAGLEAPGDLPAAELRRRALAAGFGPIAEDDSWDDVFFRAFVQAVEPRLGRSGRPTILLEWPAPLCALARTKPDDPTVALRFEAYACGLELCNAFDELCDAAEQRRRLEEDLATRRTRGKELYPIDARFLAALEEGMPPAAGIALGVDRLVMLCTGAADIRDVLAFADDEV
jgi:elongation factor P--(R)-beta-lysine ligase